jgi:hypothetical protein
MGIVAIDQFGRGGKDVRHFVPLRQPFNIIE